MTINVRRQAIVPHFMLLKLKKSITRVHVYLCVIAAMHSSHLSLEMFQKPLIAKSAHSTAMVITIT